ncbi:Ribosomal RNA large subunit methyltransferase I [Burkholderiales bacterium]|nr:Ribosomal RNA large subunit methyltransferase I [Burkholderiales bacterium]
MRDAPSITLKAGRERSLAHRHPWIFSGAIERVDGSPSAGETIAVRSHDGAFLALAAYSPSSQIRARVWTFDQVPIDAAWFAARVRAAAEARTVWLDAGHTACRIVHGESDGLPGVIADRYGDTVAVQLLSAGAERWREPIVDALVAATGASAVVERSDVEVRELEGLPARSGLLRGTLAGPVAIREDGIVYRVDVLAGQKTGFYLDQRDNRRRVRALARGRRVLNAFCYTGGFTLAALAGGARDTVSIDSSADALALARSNLAANPQLPAAGASWREADVFAELRKLRDGGQRFGMAILDPPKFAPTAAHAARAARAYKDINLLAFKLLEPGGLLATFSCSGGVSAELFQKIVAGAALDAKVDAAIVGRFAASPDHPVALAFPEGDYLKGLLVRRG